jgi:hypothetical protein
VKVVRDVSSNPEYFERLKMVGFIDTRRTHSLFHRAQKLLREGNLWSRLDHVNVTPFYGICFDLSLPSAPCLVYPYFKNGNVAKYLERNPSADRNKLVSLFCNYWSIKESDHQLS